MTLEIIIGDPGTWVDQDASVDADLSDDKWFRPAASFSEMPETSPPDEPPQPVPPGDPPNLEDRPPAGTNMHEWAAGILVEAWMQVLGTVPSPRALQAAQSIAKLESTYGWPDPKRFPNWQGHHNWGSVHCTMREAGQPRDCQRNGGCVKGFMGVDRYDGKPRPTCFAHFNTNVEGAAYFLKTLLVRRPAVAEVIDSGDAFKIALAMRRSSYFMTCIACKDEETYQKEAAVYAGLIMGSAKVIAAARKTEVLLVLRVPEKAAKASSGPIPQEGSWPRDVTDVTDRAVPPSSESTLGPVAGVIFGVALGAAGVWGYKRYLR